jgi:hypothetical protein
MVKNNSIKPREYKIIEDENKSQLTKNFLFTYECTAYILIYYIAQKQASAHNFAMCSAKPTLNQ